MADNETSLEEMLARGEIIDIGIVEIEEEELEIPVDVDDGIDRSMLPELVPYVPPKTPRNAVPLEYRAELSSVHAVRVEDAQKRLRMLPQYLSEKKGLGQKVARLFSATTEQDRINAFGDYFAEFLGNSKGYLSPAEFVVKAEIALLNLKAGTDGGRPIRKSIRAVLAGKDEKVYDAIREKLPEIARAVATTGFAIEINQIYNDASRIGRTAFEYAREIKQHKYVDAIERKLLRGGLK